MFGNCFFHKGIYSGDDNIYFFINDEISDCQKLFIASSIRKQTKNKFSYGKQFRQPNANELKAYLPINENGELNFYFMQNFIKAVEKLVIKDVVLWADSKIQTTKTIIARKMA
ncbi:hypothetical protein [Campylobacter majalis]|uniref:hypothetical protein n=1 Tax=Campylobacter majalis TaxID=2790656 RepID=UPI003D6996C8